MITVAYVLAEALVSKYSSEHKQVISQYSCDECWMFCTD